MKLTVDNAKLLTLFVYPWILSMIVSFCFMGCVQPLDSLLEKIEEQLPPRPVSKRSVDKRPTDLQGKVFFNNYFTLLSTFSLSENISVKWPKKKTLLGKLISICSQSRVSKCTRLYFSILSLSSQTAAMFLFSVLKKKKKKRQIIEVYTTCYSEITNKTFSLGNSRFLINTWVCFQFFFPVI